ncbi:SRPBCC family protein [Luteipulveratus sp. YIM 133132]|uniref:SRPBCC family protein n=1 Tax=Luteipulveratus flavus TaxID=3031728 RepID=UPI0023B1C3A4|nr:SRPBCC family protein [Luteipulveratus sp. YIM 133132]MDE9366920.1 SRPBCC family protein [Luteipulveratus sp. YIM 133132]
MTSTPTKNKNTEATDRLKASAGGVVTALAERAASAAESHVTGLTDRLTDVTDGTKSGALKGSAKAAVKGESPVKGALKGGLSNLKDKAAEALGGKGGKSSGSKKLKLTNIIEETDVGVPVRVAYNQWTEFRDFPTFMKKVEAVDQESDEKLSMKAQVFWSHRRWDATILEQVPDERIVWRSKGEKGYVDGAVTFHPLGDRLTRILVVLEYHPQGFFEHTGNIWRAVGRRARLEIKHFRRHVMTTTILNPDEVEGWRGEIRDGEVVRTHEEALEDERRAEELDAEESADGQDEQDEQGHDDYDEADDAYEESDDAYDDGAAPEEYEDDADEESDGDEAEYEEYEDEDAAYEDDAADEDAEYEDEDDEQEARRA